LLRSISFCKSIDSTGVGRVTLVAFSCVKPAILGVQAVNQILTEDEKMLS